MGPPTQCLARGLGLHSHRAGVRRHTFHTPLTRRHCQPRILDIFDGLANPVLARCTALLVLSIIVDRPR